MHTPAVILQHPRSAPVHLDDPREPPHPVSSEPPFIPPTAEEWARLDAMNGLSNLLATYGAARVMTWVRNLAAINGEDIEDRPSHRCLADGAVLTTTKFCVQCGRDNS